MIFWKVACREDNEVEETPTITTQRLPDGNGNGKKQKHIIACFWLSQRTND
jgi:hypothetical protein